VTSRSVARTEARGRIRVRIRARVRGNGERPRLDAQVIDDGKGSTLAHASSLDPGLRKGGAKGSTRDAAGRVGALVAERAKQAGVTRVVFDRGGYRYHGKVKALAEAARHGGLEF
jgi:large subunit ribosomal protein L18